MEKLYYISQGNNASAHLKNIETVCKGGIKLVQLRMKDVDETTYLETAIKAKAICNEFNTTLIINDAIEIAKKVGAGVHLGKEDESIEKAKAELKNGLIGGTANTLQDCISLIQQGVDYIGLGPFRFTETKKKLSPILGLEGYRSIISNFRKQGCTTPIYAIGGIIAGDFEELVAVGVSGIAISGLLTGKSIDEIKNIVKRYETITNSR